MDRTSDEHQKLEAYLNDGTYPYTIDLGVNSENKNNISPGASTIDVGMWDGATMYDIDCDGHAEVLLRTADGVTFGNGKKFSNNSGGNGQAITVIDGMTSALEASVNSPQDYMTVWNLTVWIEPLKGRLIETLALKDKMYYAGWKLSDGLKSGCVGYTVFGVKNAGFVPDSEKGDVNQDGSVSIADAVLLQQYLLAVKTLTAEQGRLADMDGNMTLNAIDLTLLKRALMKQ